MSQETAFPANRHRKLEEEPSSIDWARAAPLWPDCPAVIAAYHFGSSARGTSRLDSDVDLALLMAAGTEARPSDDSQVLYLGELQARLQRVLQIPRLDLVVLNQQGLPFQHTVLKSGRLIYEKDPRHRALFEARVISWYCDFLPTLRLFEKHHFKGLRRRAGIQ